MDTSTPQDALERAIAEIGNRSRLAEHLGVTLQAVSQWKQVPAERVLQVEYATGGKVSRYELRPDIFGSPPNCERQAG